MFERILPLNCNSPVPINLPGSSALGALSACNNSTVVCQSVVFMEVLKSLENGSSGAVKFSV